MHGWSQQVHTASLLACLAAEGHKCLGCLDGQNGYTTALARGLAGSTTGTTENPVDPMYPPQCSPKGTDCTGIPSLGQS